MNSKIAVILGLPVAIGLFVYLVASFLVATFDITLWYDYYRFFAVVVYFILLGGFFDALGSSFIKDKKEKKIEEKSVMDSEIA